MKRFRFPHHAAQAAGRSFILRAAGALVPLLLLVIACGGDGSGPSGSGTLSARVDGSSWNATAGIVAMRVNNFISITGSVGGNTVLTIAWPDDGPGTYSIPTSVGLNMSYGIYGNGHLWMALGIGTQLGGVGSGSVTVTTLDSERVAGTFEFTAPAAESSGATGTKVITSGVFNIKF